TALPTASSVPCVSGTANVTASRRTQPKITDTTTDMYIPTAAIREAVRVSSAMCAEASKPVIVYCDISRPSPNTNQNTIAPKPLPEKPELLIVSPKTYPSDWCRSGTMIMTRTMNTTPAMCQYAEIVFSIAVIVTLNMFTITAPSITIE